MYDKCLHFHKPNGPQLTQNTDKQTASDEDLQTQTLEPPCIA